MKKISDEKIDKENIFLRYLNSELDDKVLVSPLVNIYATAGILNKKWLSDVTLEDKMKVIKSSGIDPMYHPKGSSAEIFEDDQKHPLAWKTRVISENNNERVYESILHTDLGNLVSKTREVSGKSFFQIESPIKDEDDYEKLIWWLKAARKHTDYITSKYKKFREKIGSKDLIRFEFPLPFEVMYWIPREDPIYHLYDWPKTLRKFEEEAMETMLILMEAAVKGSANLIFFGSVGTELYNEDIFVKHMLEPSILVSEISKKLGVLSIYHCCGLSKKWIDKGYLNDIKPTFFESLSSPPIGEIDNERKYREKLSKDICTRGNLDLDLLVNGNLDEIEIQVKETIKNMKGYKHLIAGTCECLYGTTLANLKSLVNITDSLSKHFR